MFLCSGENKRNYIGFGFSYKWRGGVEGGQASCQLDISYICTYMTGYARSRDYVGTSQSPKKIPHIPLKNRLQPSHCEFCASYLLLQIVRNLHRTCNKRVGVCFSVGCVDWCGIFCGDWGSLCNPETLWTLSYVWIMASFYEKSMAINLFPYVWSITNQYSCSSSYPSLFSFILGLLDLSLNPLGLRTHLQ